MAPHQNPEPEQTEVVNMLRDAPGSDVMTISQTLQFDRAWLPDVMGVTSCAACGELAASDHVRGLGDKQACMPCSACER